VEVTGAPLKNNLTFLSCLKGKLLHFKFERLRIKDGQQVCATEKQTEISAQIH